MTELSRPPDRKGMYAPNGGATALRQWAAEDMQLGWSGFAAFSNSARALADLGVVERDVAGALEADLYESLTGRRGGFIHSGATDRASAEAAPKLLRTVPIGSSLGGDWPEGLYAVALDVFDDHFELGFLGDSRDAALARDEERTRGLDLFRDLMCLTANDDVGGSYAQTYGSGATPFTAWMQGTVGFAPSPPASARTLLISDKSDASCLKVELAKDRVSSPPVTVVHRRLDAEGAVRNMLLRELAEIEASLFRGQADRIKAFREAVARAQAVANRLAATGVVSRDQGIADDLRRALESDADDLVGLLAVSAVDPAANGARPPRLLQVVPLAAELGPLAGRSVVVRWLAVFSDRVVFLVTDHHGNPSGHGPEDLRWRLSDGKRWRKGAHSWTDWCGQPWTTHPMSVRGSLPRGSRQLTISVDAEGEEASLTVSLSDYPRSRV